jgi:hypothetical protein
MVSAARAADLTDRFFEAEFKFHPTQATPAGFHEYDSKLEDYSRADVRGGNRIAQRLPSSSAG